MVTAETYSVFDIANWFIKKGVDTHKKLQKLCYYAQAWGYVFNNVPMFGSDFEAWSHGPVNRQLWDALKSYTYRELDQNVFDNIAKTITDKDVLETLEQVWATYGGYSGFELARLSRTETPWLETRKDYAPWEPCTDIIDPEIMKKYYSALLIADGVSD